MPSNARHIRNFPWATKRTINGIVLHGSWTTSNMRNFSYSDIHRIHVKEKNYKDVGYHFIINRVPFKNTSDKWPENFIEVGRPLNQAGAHAVGVNRTTIGICLIGGKPEKLEYKDQWEDNYLFEQLSTTAKLVSELQHYFPSIQYCLGHREVQNNRTCPGMKFPFEFDRRALPAKHEDEPQHV